MFFLLESQVLLLEHLLLAPHIDLGMLKHLLGRGSPLGVDLDHALDQVEQLLRVALQGGQLARPDLLGQRIVRGRLEGSVQCGDFIDYAPS